MNRGGCPGCALAVLLGAMVLMAAVWFGVSALH
jgi:hypothetical protein